ncbi:hypothetical protein JW826_01150 [Candidatus Woesearchaeota archaeon]|nr:hypothetical protein [Candidatus Woesearchaeota archaeon]
MKVGKHDKMLLFEQEFLTLILIVLLGLLSYSMRAKPEYYIGTLGLGFAVYFWMIHEEKVHTSGKKHDYFAHTSSYIMIAQTAIAIQLLSYFFSWAYAFLISSVISVLMYSVALSRIILFKVVFKGQRQ